MRTRLTLAACLALYAACASTPPGPVDDSPAGQLANLAWMSGSWFGFLEEQLWEAHYTAPGGGMMLGMTKRHGKDRGPVDFFEFEQFQVADGKLVVRPYLKGTNSTAFTLTTLDRAARRAVFENPNHEPRTLDYWRADEETLVISVTTPRTGEVQAGEPAVQGFRVVLKRG